MRELGARLSAIAAQAIFGMPPADWLETGRCRRAAGMVRPRRDRSRDAARPRAGPTAGARPQRDAADAADASAMRCCGVIVPALRDDRGVRARTDVGRPAGRNRRAGAHAQRAAGRGALQRTIRQCRRHADGRAPGGACAAAAPELTGVATRPRTSPPRVQRMPLGQRRRARGGRDRARPAAASRASATRHASSTTRSWRRPNGTSIPTARWSRGLEGLEADDEPQLIARGAARGAGARSLRRVPDRGRPCMKSRWRKACCASSRTRRGRTPRRASHTVWLELGALAHVEPDALAFCFDAVTRGSVAEGARLEIARTAGRGVVHAAAASGPARAAGRRLPALRQLPAAGAAGEEMRVRKSRSRDAAAAATRARNERRRPCARPAVAATAKRGSTASPLTGGAHVHEHAHGRHASGGYTSGRRESRARAHAHAHQHADGTWHSHVHGGGTAHDRGRGRSAPCTSTACPRSASSGSSRTSSPGTTRYAATQPAGVRRPRHLRAEPGVEPRLGQDDAAGAHDRGAAGPRRRCAVIEGDQQTSLDADRIRATGAAAVQVNTGKGCHLDAHMVGHALAQLDAGRRQPAADRERRQPRLSRGVRPGRGAQGRHPVGDRGRGQAAQVSRHVPRRRPDAASTRSTCCRTCSSTSTRPSTTRGACGPGSR